MVACLKCNATSIIISIVASSYANVLTPSMFVWVSYTRNPLNFPMSVSLQENNMYFKTCFSNFTFSFTDLQSEFVCSVSSKKEAYKEHISLGFHHLLLCYYFLADDLTPFAECLSM
eukprot:TRINITY_DN10177_c0_g1_i2.p1 TRINITY_DN10177_c0_g1~~TRINITY_DN10177_c0_g1_i2.p1  ORF type:complete len:116 (-),score=16.07 TRINITY_DN10177_c0_g1_i2:26-373(-)